MRFLQASARYCDLQTPTIKPLVAVGTPSRTRRSLHQTYRKRHDFVVASDSQKEWRISIEIARTKGAQSMSGTQKGQTLYV